MRSKGDTVHTAATLRMSAERDDVSLVLEGPLTCATAPNVRKVSAKISAARATRNPVVFQTPSK